MFDWKKPTVQMLGRWQPWHKGHQELFKRCIKKTGQVIIQVRDVEGVSGGSGQDDNPFGWEEICKNIEENLESDGFQRGVHFEIMLVPNITNITYGRGVGYEFEEEIFEEVTEYKGNPFKFKGYIDLVVKKEDSFVASLGFASITEQVLFLGVVTFIIWALESLFEYLYMIEWRGLAQNAEHQLRVSSYDHAQRLDLEWH